MISWFGFRLLTSELRCISYCRSFHPTVAAHCNNQQIVHMGYTAVSTIYSIATSRACLVSSRQQTLDRPYLYSFIPTLPSQSANQASCIIQRQKCTYLLSEVVLSPLASRSRVLKSVSRLTTTQSTKSTKSVDGTPSQSIISNAQRLTHGTSANHRRRRKIGGLLISSRDCTRCVRRRHPRAVIADRLQQMLLMYTCRPRSTGGVKLLPTTLNNPPSSLGRSSLFCCRMTKKLLKTINTNPYS